MKQFDTAVVTGGASGLGAAMVDRLRAHGAAVMVSDVRADALRAFVNARRGDGGPPIHAHLCDVTDPAAVQTLFDASVAAIGGIDLWVNNAGVAAAGACEDTPVEDWRRVIEVDLMGVVWGSRVVLPHLQARGRGALLNVASAAGLVCGPQMAAYNTAKEGVIGLTRSIHTDLVGTGVTVTVLCPTFFQTNLLDTATGDGDMLGMGAKLMDRSPYTAEWVAGIALNDALRGRLFSVPMADGRWIWRLRRLLPQRSGELIGRIYQRGRARMLRRRAARG